MENNEELLKPKYDVVFHALFGEKNKELAETFISDLIGQEVKIQNVLDRHLSITAAEQKLGIMDYRAILTDNTYCNIEIQLQEQNFEIERFLYYLADTYSRQLTSGEGYNEINKTVSIVILDHEIDVLKYFNRLDVKWQMRDNITGVNLLTDKFELCIIELPKARRLYGEMIDNKTCNWMMFLDNPNSEEVQKIMEKDENVKEAYKKLKYLSKDEDMRRIAELKEKARRDAYGVEQFNIQKGLKKGMKEGLEKGFKQGIEQGIEQGIKQGIKKDRIDIAKNMLKKNIDIEVISDVTKLTVEEIEKLKD